MATFSYTVFRRIFGKGSIQMLILLLLYIYLLKKTSSTKCINSRHQMQYTRCISNFLNILSTFSIMGWHWIIIATCVIHKIIIGIFSVAKQNDAMRNPINCFISPLLQTALKQLIPLLIYYMMRLDECIMTSRINISQFAQLEIQRIDKLTMVDNLLTERAIVSKPRLSQKGCFKYDTCLVSSSSKQEAFNQQNTSTFDKRCNMKLQGRDEGKFAFSKINQ